jgi:hypothetical protein
MRLWRLTRAGSTALDGAGTLKHGGRYSPPGAPVANFASEAGNLDLADRMLRRAKASRGLIDAHLQDSYGPDVDSLYYYAMNMKRLAFRLNELGLHDGVRDIGRRVNAAVAEYNPV